MNSIESKVKVQEPKQASWIGSKDDDFVLVRRDCLRSSDSAALLAQGQNASEFKDVSKPDAQEKKKEMRDLAFVRASGKKMGGSGSLPPPLNLVVSYNKTFRFQSTSATSSSVTVGALLGAAGTICTTANTGVTTMSSAVRLRKITIFPSPSSTGVGYSEIYFASSNTGYAPDKLKAIDIPEGVTDTRPVTFVPPAKSLVDDWMNSIIATQVVFYGQISVGSIIDVELDLCLSTVLAPVQITIATGTLGNVYYLPLDGPSSNRWQSSHMNTTH